MTARLSVLMFLQFTVLGSWVPIHGLYLKSLAFAPSDIAWIFATAAIGSMLAPLPWSQIADRLLAAEKCISFCALTAGVVLWLLAEARSPEAIFWGSLVYWIFMMPVLSLIPSLSFRHLTHPERQYGPVRMWGTVGWMSAGWLLTLWFTIPPQLGWPRQELADGLRWGAILAWILAAYALTLPATPPLPRVASAAAIPGWLHRYIDSPLEAVRLFRVRSFAIYMICFFGLYVSWPFNLQMTALLVEELGVAERWMPAVMSLAQSTEMLTLGLLPWILGRFDQKGTMVVGIISWAVAVSILALGQPAALVIGSLMLHGFFITCFLVAGQVFVNRIARHDFRASVQGLLVLVNGFGVLTGNFLVAWIRERVADDYPRAFLPAAAGVTILALLFAIGFRPTPDQQVRRVVKVD